MNKNKFQLAWMIVAMLLLSLAVGQAVIAPSPAEAISNNSVAVSDKGTFEYGSYLQYDDYLPFVTNKVTICDDVTEIPKAECEALVALYISTDGDNWIDHTNWLVKNYPSMWYGVWLTSTQTVNSIVMIDLQSNRLRGRIPSELENLKNLEYLDLYNNQLNGSIPPELGNLTSLELLYLGYNQLSGSIPPELGNLPNLAHLSLGPNQLTGEIPPELGNLVNLDELGLDRNQLTGNIPPELGSLNHLIWLDLFDNQLSGSIPPELGDMVNLMGMMIQNNQFTGSIPLNFTNLSKIENFHFYDTNLCEPDTPEYIAWKTNVFDYKGTGVICP